MSDTINVSVSTSTPITATISSTARSETFRRNTFTGDNSTVAFTLSYTPRINSELVFINGILQEKTTEYSITAKVLTFITAPLTAYKIEVIYVQN
jgi:hypothetical protein